MLNLSFLAPVFLAVALSPELPQLHLELEAPTRLDVSLDPQVPLLRLDVRQPTVLDAALLPVLVGPPGPAGSGSVAAPVSRTLAWASGQLVGVAYADGRSKALTWAGDQLARVDHQRPGLPTLRAELAYNPDGTLASVSQSEI